MIPFAWRDRQACPPEDCGGVPGYYDLLEVLQNPDDERYEETREWIGDDFDARGLFRRGCESATWKRASSSSKLRVSVHYF